MWAYLLRILYRKMMQTISKQLSEMSVDHNPEFMVAEHFNKELFEQAGRGVSVSEGRVPGGAYEVGQLLSTCEVQLLVLAALQQGR